jgi:hypothetical protein
MILPPFEHEIQQSQQKLPQISAGLPQSGGNHAGGPRQPLSPAAAIS